MTRSAPHIGKLNGSSSVRADDLAAIPTRALKARIARVDSEAEDDTLLERDDVMLNRAGISLRREV